VGLWSLGPRETSPSSPTSGCTRCSTVVRSPPASRPATGIAARLQGHGWSRRCSTRLAWVPEGHLAIGHCRYSTTGGSTWENAQPTLGGTEESTVALAHNGNLINSSELRDLLLERHGDKFAAQLGGELHRGNTTDTALVTPALQRARPQPRGHRTAGAAQGQGAFSFVFMNEQTLYAARDRHGIRPLVLGRLERGWVVASEQAALATVGASVIREVQPVS